MENITLQQAGSMLLEHDNILILMHRSPDGDAIGSAYALCMALRKAGKRAQPVCSDPIPPKYGYFTDGTEEQDFEPQFIVSVDLASEALLGTKLEQYAGRVDLCIDHHGSNTGFARFGSVDPSAAACAQSIAELIALMGIEIDPLIADAVFTGITTDTGCFRFANTNADTYRAAAEMIDKGARGNMINRLMFDTKSRSQLEIERMALSTLKYCLDGRIAAVRITTEMMERSGADESETEAIASMPRQIEGVLVGITVKQKPEGVCRISVRASEEIDASEICRLFGGGGHKGAAGCTVTGTPDEAEELLTAAAARIIESRL